MNILISACLLGHDCRYDGKKISHPGVQVLANGSDTLFPFCPEVAAGLPTPRLRAECKGNLVITEAWENVTEIFEDGAKKAVHLALMNNCKVAILKERSPSCGCGQVYDGSFSGRLKKGSGVTARHLMEAGVFVLGESNLDALLHKNQAKPCVNIVKQGKFS